MTESLGNISIALLHYPMLSKKGETVATAVTNLDIHDISRSAKTYGVREFGIITPIKHQQQMVARLIRHWKHGSGGEYNPNRKEALELVSVHSSFDDFIAKLTEHHGFRPIIIGTTAKDHPEAKGFSEVRDRLKTSNSPIVLAFGTGWGLTPEAFQAIDIILAPIRSFVTPYNHLSVRAAVAIVLDRLFGERDVNPGNFAKSREAVPSD
ncbi:MAG TPA: RNA methyltransferase [Bdellovibrionota bacterium]|nr:RNA methyltransferase [Bdellovibrionota bacterium]